MQAVQEQLLFMTTGLLVVFGLMALIILFVELIVKYDEWLRRGGGLKKAVAIVPELKSEELPVEVAAAIGLALHEFSGGGVSRRGGKMAKGGANEVWPLAGRLSLMNSRERVTWRRQGRGDVG